MYFDSRDHPFCWFATRENLEQGENIADALATFRGLIWDVGANAGIYSLWLASRGNKVISFDLSPKCIAYIQKSAARNGLKSIVTVARALSVEPLRYRAPQTAIAGNQLASGNNGGDVIAITFKEAAAEFGVPNAIKMDIEAHEEAFLRSKEFKDWVLTNKIKMVMELHKPEFWDLVWKDVKTTKLHPMVVLIEPG
jgi:FkbM family methyltransferase